LYKAKIAVQLILPMFFCNMVRVGSEMNVEAQEKLRAAVWQLRIHRPDVSFEECFLYYETANMAWPGTVIPFGYAYHIYSRCSKPAIMLIDPVKYFYNKFGERRERFVAVLKESPFSDLCMNVLNATELQSRPMLMKLLAKCYFLVEEGDMFGPLPFKRDSVILPSGIPHNWEYSPAVNELISREDFDVLLSEIHLSATRIVQAVMNEELSREFNLPAFVNRMNMPKGKRVLAVRLALLYLGKEHQNDLDAIARMSGYLGPKNEVDDKGRQPTNLSGFQTYIDGYGLNPTAIADPLFSERVFNKVPFDHELRLVREYPKRNST
jgi:hypothetical protein